MTPAQTLCVAAAVFCLVFGAQVAFAHLVERITRRGRRP